MSVQREAVAGAILAACGIEPVFIAAVIVLGRDLGIPGFHPVFVLFRRVGACPSDELSQSVKVAGDELAKAIATRLVGKRFVVDLLCQGQGLTIGWNQRGE